jgi:cardiolipin synthase A/B
MNLAPPLLLSLFCMVGCSSLPSFVPDLSRRGARSAQKTHSVQLMGEQGLLSKAKSEAVMARLKSAGTPTSIFDRHLALEEAMVGSPLVVGNRVLILQDGPDTYGAMLAAIWAAKDHINMETYILDHDEIGRQFAQALIAKQASGVQVNLIRDSVGTFNTPTAFFEQLSNAGINVLEYNPINPLQTRKDWTLNQRDHRKLLIVDGRMAFLGGINISSVYSGGSFGKVLRPRSDGGVVWRDTDLQIEGPVVADFQKLFMETWTRQAGAALAQRNYFPALTAAGAQVVRAIGSSPEDPFSLIYATLLSAIHNAESSIHITNAYFVPDPQLLAALEAAAQRGVDVQLILPGQTDSWLVFHAGRSYYTRLLKAGVKIHQRRGVILHSKTALIDGVWATVGSTNMDWRSFLHNQELNAVVLGGEFGAQVQAMFDKDLASSDPISLERWQQRSFDHRIKEWFGRVWEYWL